MSVPTEFLNSQVVTGLPPHELVLKPNMPIMLMRNLNPAAGLCNGTILVVVKVIKTRHLLVARIITGRHAGREVIMPRIELSPEEDMYPFEWKRRQFPIRPAFAMTINKSQGQTLEQVGLDLEHQCFAHGQLYVAISRIGNPAKLRVLSKKDLEMGGFWAKNVVLRDALTST